MSEVNEEYQHIFIHNPKVAGSWMEQKGFVGGSAHQSLFGFQCAGVNLDQYYKWMFVRNPYDRLVSSYLYSKTTVGRPNVSMRNHFWMLDSFDRYVRNLEELFDFSKSNFDQSVRDFVNVHIIPQHYFACIDGELRLDFVGKLEQIATDWPHVCAKLGVKASIEHGNKTQRQSHWLDFYSAETLNIVNQKYHRDFELFGYNKLAILDA